MPIPAHIVMPSSTLPETPGVYLYYSTDGELLYVGKAVNLARRVKSYFREKEATDAYGLKIQELVSRIARIEWRTTTSALQALLLEANLVRAHKPFYNVRLTDDKSFLYLAITQEAYPRFLWKRGLELVREGVDVWAAGGDTAGGNYLAVFGPYLSPHAAHQALALLRRSFPWSACTPPAPGKRGRACFNAHLRLCPGVCTGAVSARTYRATVRALMRVLAGDGRALVRALERRMRAAALALRFEEAGRLKRERDALLYVQDTALLTRDFSPEPFLRPDADYVHALGRVEAFDISHLGGTGTVAAMAVFEQGRPAKHAYRRFRVRTAAPADDYAALREVITRRLARAESHPNTWPLPDVMVIDGGKGQVEAARTAMEAAECFVPLVGLAKGADRKQDVLIYDHTDTALAAIVHAQKPLFQKARDEAHRFAGSYQRKQRRLKRDEKSEGTQRL
jgi:excinuclease ABC subunit C